MFNPAHMTNNGLLAQPLPSREYGLLRLRPISPHLEDTKPII